MKIPSNPSDSRAATKTAPREPHTHLIFFGFLAAAACYSGLFLRVQIESLFATRTYKDTPWSLALLASERLRALFHTRMRVAFLSAVGFCAGVFAQTGVVDSYIARESPIAKAGVLANIGPNGSRSAGAKVCFQHNDVESACAPDIGSTS
jgi:hypothetical protein